MLHVHLQSCTAVKLRSHRSSALEVQLAHHAVVVVRLALDFVSLLPLHSLQYFRSKIKQHHQFREGVISSMSFEDVQYSTVMNMYMYTYGGCNTELQYRIALAP